MFGGGGGSDGSVTIQITGSSSGLQAAVVQAQRSLNSLTQAANDTGSGGFSAFQRFAITLGEISELAQAAAQAMQPLIDAIEEAVTQMFDLNVQTERNVYNWRFLYGVQQSQQLAAWTQQFSMQIPFTRQDLMGAVTRLGSQGFTPEQAEQYISVISDIASTQGRPGLDLTWATQAVVEAMMGRSQMLKMDLNINPALLQAKYGYDPHNAQATLLPALEAYARARGELGASAQTAQNTWWGLWSSFIDRMQNFGLEAGGTDASGNPIKGGMFAEMKGGLEDVSNWMDKHKADVKALADLIGGVLGGAVHDAKLAFDGLVNGLQQTGIGNDIEGMFKHLSTWLDNPDTEKSITAIATAFGQVGGAVAQILGAGLGDVGQLLGGLFNGLSNNSGGKNTVLDGLQSFGKMLADPKFQQHLHDTGDFIGSVLGGGFQIVSQFVGLVVQGLGNFNTALGTMFGFINNSGQMNPFLKALNDIGKLVAMLAVGLGYMVVFLGDIARIISDLNNPLALHNDLNQLSTDWQNFGKGETQILNGYGLQIGAHATPEKALTAKQEAQNAAKQRAAINALLSKLEADAKTAAKKGGAAVADFFIGALQDELTGTSKKQIQNGQDIVANFIKGMENQQPKLKAASQGIAQTIADFFHHSTPAVGPLHGDDVWMDHMVSGFANSLHRGIPLLSQAALQLAGSVAGPLGLGPGGLAAGGASAGAGLVGAYAGPMTSYGDSVQNNHFYGQTAAMVERIVDRKLATRDRASNVLRRQPGTLAITGASGAGRGSY